MLIFNLRMINGTADDAIVLRNCLAEWDDCFENFNPSLVVNVDELYGHIDETDTMDELAVLIAKALPNSTFTISGCVDTSEKGGEIMDFLIEYQSKKLISKHSCWYLRLDADFDEYAEFAEIHGNKYTEAQFEIFREKDHFILDSGYGDCVNKVPLEYENEIDLNRQNICPVCGESLHLGVPVCEDKTGKQYHIWCAEAVGIDAEII